MTHQFNVVAKGKADSEGYLDYKNLPALFEQAQQKVLSDHGIDLANFNSQKGVAVFVKSMTILVYGRVRENKTVTIKTKVKINAASLIFTQQLLGQHGESVIFESTLCFIDSHSSNIIGIPKEIYDCLGSTLAVMAVR